MTGHRAAPNFVAEEHGKWGGRKGESDKEREKYVALCARKRKESIGTDKWTQTKRK